MEKFKSIRKTFLWLAVCILIGEVVVGAILILTQSWNEVIGKLMATLALVAVVLFVGINNFIRMEKGDKTVRPLALMSFAMNMVWLVLATLLIWEVIPFVWQEKVERAGSYGRYNTYVTTETHLTVMAKIMLAAASLGSAGFWTSNILAIKETVKPVKPLKITAVVCELYCCFYSIVYVLFGVEQTELSNDWGRWSALSGLAGLAFAVTAIAAWVVSRTNRNKEKSATNVSQNNQEMQVAIREMVEKEVQERLKAEREKAERAAMPPLQSDDMPPSVSHDNDLKGGNEDTSIGNGGLGA